MTDIIAVDSLTYSRWKRTNPYHGLIGAAVSIHAPKKFKTEYIKTMTDSLQKVGLKSTKVSYSSSALAGRFFDELGSGYNELGKFLKSFVNSLCDNISISIFLQLVILKSIQEWLCLRVKKILVEQNLFPQWNFSEIGCPNISRLFVHGN